jgi:DNA-binding NtrC family response regulator
MDTTLMNFEELQELDDTYFDYAGPHGDLSEGFRVLVVEDDPATATFVTEAIRKVKPDALISWAASEESAQSKIMAINEIGLRFDAVVADILLQGHFNGVELWKKIPELRPHLIYMSSLDYNVYFDMFPPSEINVPPFMSKPLKVDRCMEVLESHFDKVGALS